MVTQVTGVQDVKTKCDQSCTRMEEEVINSSLRNWQPQERLALSWGLKDEQTFNK